MKSLKKPTSYTYWGTETSAQHGRQRLAQRCK